MIEIRETPMGGKIRDFLDVVDRIYERDPAYVRPLDMDLKERLDPKKNPFFTHAEGTIFTAHEGGRCVGRITAQIDRDHLAKYDDATGFFGFLDTVNDQAVATALLERAEAWLTKKGMKRARGPVSLSINEELGCLVEGFDTSPFIMMPHHLPYQAALIEGAGYAKAKDVFAWRYETSAMSARVRKAHDDIAKLPEVGFRALDPGEMERDVGIVVDIFNDAWSDNWGSVPISSAEAKKMAQDFKLILIPEITRVVMIDGEPAAFAVAIPNINSLISDLDGKLLPTGILKLLYRLKIKGPESGRLMLLGIRKKYRGVKKYAALSAFLYVELNDAGRKIGMTWGELGWTLEDNSAINTAIRLLGAKKYKTYRVFEKALEPKGALS